MKKQDISLSMVIPDLKGGGAQKMMLNMAAEFARRDYQVDLIVLCKSDDDDLLPPVHPNINLIKLEKKRAVSSFGSLLRYFRQHANPLMISALSYVNVICIVAKILSFNARAKLIVTERAYHSVNAKLASSKFYTETLLIKLFYRCADYVVGISKGVSEDIKRVALISGNKVKTIYNPVITDSFIEKAVMDAEAGAYVSPDSVKVIACGRLVPVKDYPTLIHAISLLKREGMNIELGILGQGPEKQNLVELTQKLRVDDSVHFWGFVGNPIPYYKQADIFALSSLSEGFGNVIVEAMYCETQIACTDCPSGPTEILEHGKFGYLSLVGDANAFAHAICKCIKSPVSKREIKSRACFFSVQNSCDAFESLF